MSECTGCTPGYYCQGYGNIVPDGNCSARYYCSGNASLPSPVDGSTGNGCPVGHFCPSGSPAPILCVPGTFTDTTLNEACLSCTPGHYCITGSNPEDCPAGYYCPEGTGHIWKSCPAGTFSAATGLANETQCTQCTAGHYCNLPNATTISGPCDAGYYCRIGSDQKQPTNQSAGDAGICPFGHYCPQLTGDPVECPAGTFNNQTGLVSEGQCQDCLGGYYCDTPGLGFPTGLCEAGFYCAGRSNTSRPAVATSSGGPCPTGTFNSQF